MNAMNFNFGVLVSFFLLAFLMVFDPLGLNVSDSSILPALYVLPFVAVYYFVLFKPFSNTYSKKDISNEQKEKIQSIVRHLFSGVGLAVSLGLKIPYLDKVVELITVFNDNLDSAVSAINILIGIGLTFYGVFKNKKRFEARGLIEPRKV